MSDSGWQQPPVVPKPEPPKCLHLGAFFASFSIHLHPEGHTWKCTCGQLFVVVSDAGKNKKLVPRNRRE